MGRLGFVKRQLTTSLSLSLFFSETLSVSTWTRLTTLGPFGSSTLYIFLMVAGMYSLSLLSLSERCEETINTDRTRRVRADDVLSLLC